MAYAIKTEIESEFKDLKISASGTAIIETEATRFINEAGAEIDAYISKIYTLPVTASDALLLLKKICIDLVTFRITKILSIKNAFIVPESKIIQEITEGTAYRHALKLLDELKKGNIDLVGAEKNQTYGAMKSYTKENSLEPIFQRYNEQW